MDGMSAGLQEGSKLYAWFEYQSGGTTRQRYVALGAERPVSGEWAEYELSIDDLPLASSGQMRLQFHLVGEGEAWIDFAHVLLNCNEFIFVD